MKQRCLPSLAAVAAACLSVTGQARTPVPDQAALNAIAAKAMASTGAKGIALAISSPGKIDAIGAWGARNARGDPLQTDTVMYGASLTKSVFAYSVIQLVREKRLTLDQPLADLLPRPLSDYTDPQERSAPWNDLAGDPRWRAITARMALTHSTGFANFFWLNPDGKLTIHFTPGSRYAYSGDGMILLQFALEHGLRLDLGKEMQRRVFDRFAMRRTAMRWRADFAPNLANGWKEDGTTEPHDERGTVRAAGSMDTTIGDFARFSAALLKDRGTLAQMARPGLAISTTSQFPTLQPELPLAQRNPGLAAGLGVVAFTGPLGPGFYKGGHNDSTGNMWICLLRQRRCLTMLSNDVRAEAAFPAITRAVLGETGMPWVWEYGQHSWSTARSAP